MYRQPETKQKLLQHNRGLQRTTRSEEETNTVTTADPADTPGPNDPTGGKENAQSPGDREGAAGYTTHVTATATIKIRTVDNQITQKCK